METKFNPKDIEQKWYQEWLNQKVFESTGEKEKTPYSIALPPPNVTGKLHLGHALNLSIQDALIRRKRMQGYDTLWIPGTDHAGIATQAKVEEKLRAKGLSRYDLGREAFLEEVWKWKDKYAQNIHDQWSSMGISIDYSKERFTLDEGLSKSVKKVFVELYKKGLIYQGNRIISWDPVFKTALSDIEVNLQKEEVELYYLKYSLEDGTSFIPVATTRPETIFGDVAIAVNPEDERYKHFIGQYAIVPISGQRIPIIADEYPKMEFGTGAIKVTPAHDANDFEIGKRHDLEAITVLDEEANLNELTGAYQGLSRFEARKKLAEDLQKQNLLIKTEKYEKEIGYSERSKEEVEPRLSLQWFVKMDSLAEKALAFQQTEEKINFVPKEAEERYLRWISNIHDWCISRQLWWGHRIPVWYCDSCNEMTVEELEPTQCKHCGSKEIKQDEDVLDTWFSSGLWAFSTLDWIDDSPLYQRYYPTSALVTAYDIIFFWVSRMIFSSLEFTAQKPFQDVLIHGLVLDKNGDKMSKSKGNGIDPMVLIEEHGADALRYMLLTSISLGNDMKFNKEKVESAHNFGIKLWNASRYILMNQPEGFTFKGLPKLSELSSADKWILSRLNTTIKIVNDSFEAYDFAKAGHQIRSFFFDEFCDEYIELTKDMDEKEKEIAFSVLFYSLDQILRLLHPFMPFLTEEIWSNLGCNEGLLMVEAFPSFDEQLVFEKEEKTMKQLIELISSVRSLKQQANSKEFLPMFIDTELDDLKNYQKNIRRRCKINFLSFASKDHFYGKTVTLPLTHAEIHLPFLGLYDIQEEKNRLQKEADKWQKEINRCQELLSKESFIQRAKPEIVQKERDNLLSYQEKHVKTIQLLQDINQE